MSEKYPVSGTQMHGCDKPDCWFCEITNRPVRDDVSFRKNGWSVNDIKFLNTNYATMKPKDIARRLKKSTAAIWTKSCELGVTIKKRRVFSPNE